MLSGALCDVVLNPSDGNASRAVFVGTRQMTLEIFGTRR